MREQFSIEKWRKEFLLKEEEGSNFKIGEIRSFNNKKYKKVGEGKWVEVSEHGMTRKEHEDTAKKINASMGGKHGSFLDHSRHGLGVHSTQASKLSDKVFSDKEVGLDR